MHGGLQGHTRHKEGWQAGQKALFPTLCTPPPATSADCPCITLRHPLYASVLIVFGMTPSKELAEMLFKQIMKSITQQVTDPL